MNIAQSRILKIFFLPKFGGVNLWLCSAAAQGRTSQKMTLVPVTCALDGKGAPMCITVCVCEGKSSTEESFSSTEDP